MDVSLEKLELGPSCSPLRQTPHPMDEAPVDEEPKVHAAPSDEEVLNAAPDAEEFGFDYEGPQIVWHGPEGSQPLLSQLSNTMISQLDAQSSQASTQ